MMCRWVGLALETLLRLGDDGVEQSLAADGLKEGGIDPGHFLPEDLAEPLGILGQMLVADNLEGRYRHFGRERKASEGGAVLAGLNGQHDLVVGQDCRDGEHTAREGLADGDHVGTDALMVAGKHASGASDTGLDLVSDEQDLVLLAEVVTLLQIAVVGHVDSGLALDRLG